MTFYSPKPKGKVFDINGYPNANGRSGENEYAVNKSGQFVVFNAANDRSVVFRGFLQDFGIDTAFEIEEQSGGGSTFYYNKGTGITYNLKIDVPANSVNDAMNNLARFAELERMISLSLDQTSNAASDSAIIQANTFFSFNNLIQDGLYHLDDVRDPINKKNGIPGIIKDLTFEPDLEQGFFEYNNRFLAKSYSLSLKIDLIADDGDTRYVKGFPADGKWSDSTDELVKNKRKESLYKNVRYWPFGIKVTNDGGYSTLASINKHNQNATDTYANNKGAFLGIAKKVTDSDLHKWVVFKSFLTNFTYAKKNEVKEIEDSTMAAGKMYSYTGDKKYDWNITISVPNDSVNEAVRNLAKLNVLYRMGILANPTSGVGNNGSDVCVKLSNLIYNPNKGSSLNYNSHNIINEGLLCKMSNIGLTINTEMGFFEYHNHFLPKQFDLNISLKYTDSIEWGSQVSLDNVQTGLPSDDNFRWPFGMNYDTPSVNISAFEEVLETFAAGKVSNKGAIIEADQSNPLDEQTTVGDTDVGDPSPL